MMGVMKLRRFPFNLYLPNIGAAGRAKLKKLRKPKKLKNQVQKAFIQERPKWTFPLNIDVEEDEEEESPQLTRKKTNRQKQPILDECSKSGDSSPNHMTHNELWVLSISSFHCSSNKL